MVIRNKRGWMRILEATIAVMLVSGVLVVVYSRQVDRGIAPADYFYSLQKQILADISSRSDFRLAVLNVAVEDESDGNFSMINNFVNGTVSDDFGYSLRFCDLDNVTDYCKMSTSMYVATKDRDIFVEQIIISSELGNGENGKYGARKLRFFIWELR